jgi:hypothetical protein
LSRLSRCWLGISQRDLAEEFSDGVGLLTCGGVAWRGGSGGGVGGVICTLFLALLILNLAIWLALIGLVLAALCAMLAAAGS